MASSPVVSAVVVCHRCLDVVWECVESLLASELPAEIILVDNSPPTERLKPPRKLASKLRLIVPKSNLGYSGGCNLGYRKSGGTPFVAFMNPDVVVKRDTLALMVKALQENEHVGCAAPLLLRPNGKIDSAGQTLSRLTLEVVDIGYGAPPEEAGRWVDSPRRILSACGALALYRREALEDASRTGGNPFPDEYFAFWEDLELGWRLNVLGWRCRYTPEAVAVHHRGHGAKPKRGPLRWRRPVHLEAMILSNKLFTLVRHLHLSDMWRVVRSLVLWDLPLMAASMLRRPTLLLYLARRMKLLRRQMTVRKALPKIKLEELP